MWAPAWARFWRIHRQRASKARSWTEVRVQIAAVARLGITRAPATADQASA
jgi:hypothetical protein